MKRAVKILEKIVIIITIIMILNNFMAVPIANADDAIGEKGQNFFLSFIGLLTLPIRAIVLGLGYAVNSLTAAVAFIEGATDAETDIRTITPFDIFFNKVKILDVNFFQIGTDVNIVNTIRTGVAAWYYALRLIAVAILLVILIYVGIRMAISTIATDKAMYKKMLFDWVVSLVLIFFINYIIIFVITVNNIIVEAIGNSVDAAAIADTYDTIRNLGFKWIDIDSIPATVIYIMLVVQTLSLVFTYFNRMLKVAFLIIISPLITLTYAVDKMGDGKAQALNNWLREFIFTVITQIFHCIIYMSMINVAFDLLLNRSEGGIRNALTAAVVAILCVNFVQTAEDLVRKILMHNHQDSSLSVAGGMAATAVALQKSKSFGKATRSAINATKDNIRTAGNMIKSTPKAIKSGITSVRDNRNAEKAWRQEGKELTGVPSKKEDKVAYKAKKNTYKEAYKARQQQQREKAKQLEAQQKANKKAEARISKTMDKKGLGSARRPHESDEQYEARRKEAEKIIEAKDKKKQSRKNAVRRIKGVKSKLSRIGAESKTLQFVGKVAKGYTALGIGAFTGSMMYGATGDVGKAGAMAVAGYRMNREFQKTAGSIENQAVANLYGAGARTKDEALGMLHNIAANQEYFDGKSQESVKMANDLLKAIGDQLIAAGVDPKYKTLIRNEIDRATLKSPQNMQHAIANALSQIPTTTDGRTGGLISNQGLVDACNAYSQFANMKQVYSQMAVGQEFGISADAFVQECTERFVSTASESSVIEEYIASSTSGGEAVSESETELRRLYLEPEALMQQEISQMSNATFEQTTENLVEREEEIRDILRNSEEIEESIRQQYEIELRELERMEEAMVDRIVSDEQTALTDSQKEILRNANRRCSEEIDSILVDMGITSVTSTGKYYDTARRQAGISENELAESGIDSIIETRKQTLQDIRSGKKVKTRKTAEQVESSIKKAELFRDVSSLKERKQQISTRIGKK